MPAPDSPARPSIATPAAAEALCHEWYEAYGRSVYNYFRRMLEFRGRTKAFSYGTYEDLDPKNVNVFAYTRTLGNEKYLVVLNVSNEALSYSLPGGVKAGTLQVSNLGKAEENTNTLKLKAWEARVYKQ